MRRLTKGIVASVFVALAGAPLTAAPALATSFGYVEGNGGQVPYQSCKSFTYDWAASDDSGAAYDWDATATLYDPNGGWVDADYPSGSSGEASDSDSFDVCWDQSAGSGSYEIQVDVTFYDDAGDVVDSGTGSGSMDVTLQPRPARKATRSSLHVSDKTPHYKEKVTFALRSQVRRGGSWAPARNAYMVLAGRCLTPGGDSGWVALAAGNVNRRGRGWAQFIYDIPHSWRCKYVSVTPRTATLKASVSDVVKVRTSTKASARSLPGGGSLTVPRGRALRPSGTLSSLLSPQ